jgi:hypothetical protein
MSARPSTESAPARPAANWTLWLWVAGGFLFLSLLWTGMFIASRHADTRTVPTAKTGGTP